MSLENYRQQIDILDEELLNCLYRRLEICKEVAAYKKQNNLPMMQPNRIKAVLEKVSTKAQELGLSKEFINKLYIEIFSEAFKIEDEIIESRTAIL